MHLGDFFPRKLFQTLLALPAAGREVRQTAAVPGLGGVFPNHLWAS